MKKSSFYSNPPDCTTRLERADLPESVPDCTHAIQQAMDRLAANGGGTLRLGPGTWETTTLYLRDGIRFHLERGAVLLGSTDLSLYPRKTANITNSEQSGIHLIYAEGLEDIALEGEGIIDGQDTAYWRKAETEEERPYGVFDYYVHRERPSPLIELYNCRRVRVEDLTLRRSPSWTLHLCCCDDVLVQNVRIRNHLMGPNADGITVNGSRNVRITGCDVVAGDDAFCVKASEPDYVSENIMVTDCFAASNCSCFGTGADVKGIIRNVTFANCICRGAMRMLQVNMWDDGLTENVTFSNISGQTFPQEGVTCERAIYLDVQQWIRKEPTLGRIRNILFSNIHCRTRGRIVMTAQDGAVLENIVLRDVHLDIPEIEDPAEAVPATRSYQCHNYNPATRALRAAVVADNLDGLRLDGVSVQWPGTPEVPMHALALRNVRDLQLNNPRLRSSDASIPDRLQTEA